ncbi:MAG TPA: undecaprenyl diphosphate synthase family protein, partial [Phycicoccus sp.]|nr:undecaprenyl diphosphate synthase family protein [Phycicoccus sp.]HRA44288.1 undecaprenyl diphosphate synthase family protein [Phycicoccus sp.]
MGLQDVLYAAYARRLSGQLKNTPRHVGVMLDGNRRWAKARGSSTADGHRAGAANIANLL